jgi:hypothetical protein
VGFLFCVLKKNRAGKFAANLRREEKQKRDRTKDAKSGNTKNGNTKRGQS